MTLVISPHLDDGVLSCGAHLAGAPGSVVLTVFAGRPARYEAPTPWDAAAGFQAGEDAVGMRREEDRAALAVVAATPAWLDFPDSQYGSRATAQALANAVEGHVRRARTILFPLGLFHEDHKRTHEAMRVLLPRIARAMWFAYEDVIYRRIPGLVDERLAELERDGLHPRPAALATATDLEVKRRAIACYRSQLRALSTPGRPGYADVLEPERYWRVRP